MTLHIATHDQIVATNLCRCAPSGAEVYLIHSPDGLYKIGHSKNAGQRLITLRGETGKRLKLIHRFWAHDALNTEKMLHGLFHDKRVVGEWFALSPPEVGMFLKVAAIVERRTSQIEGRYATNGDI